MTIDLHGRRISFKSAPEPERKSFTATELKLTDAGDITVAFAQLNVVDRDADITMPGAMPAKSVPMSDYGHSSWGSRLPAGKGAIREEAGWAIFEGKFFLSTDQGRNAYQTVKDMADLQEWSYGYLPIDYEYAQQDGQQVRILKKLDVYEVSPVLAGAGVGTHTRAIKAVDPGSGLPYADHLSLGLEMVKAIVARSKERAEFRAKEGRTLSGTTRDRLTGLATALGETLDSLQGLLDETAPTDGAAKVAPQVQALLEEARFLGVSV